MITYGPDPAALWKAAATGDQSAFAQIFERHADRVFNHCVRRTLSRADAEDVMADVFAKTWQRRDVIHLSSDGDILAWLLATANNLLRQTYTSELKRRTLVTRYSAEHTATHELNRPELLADEQLHDMQTLKQIHIVLDQLREPDREVIWLCVIEGIPTHELSRVTGERASTIRSRLTRALQRARRLYTLTFMVPTLQKEKT